MPFAHVTRARTPGARVVSATLATLTIALATLAAPVHAQSTPWTVTTPAPAGFDRALAQRASQAHLTALIGLNTQNPPGNELLTARYFDSVFAAVPGVERHVLPVANGRANFVARLKATNPTKRPVLVMGHMDVVGVDSTKWKTNPFAATIVQEGDVSYLYGRGAIDDKGMLSTAVAALQQLALKRDQLDRDVIFMATAAEEGGPEVGIDEMVSTHFALIKDAEFALNEGGRVRVSDGMVKSVNIQTTEKVSYNVVAKATGQSGHASVPLAGNVLAALARAVSRVHEWKAPVMLNETTRLYFARLARIEQDPAMKAAMLRVSVPGASAVQINAAAKVLSREPLHNAVLRTGQSLTLLNGGIRSNVIPSEGSATFNVRVLPTDDITRTVAQFNRVGGESQVVFTLDGTPRTSPPVSPVSTALYQAMEQAATAMVPTTTVIPFMSTGATDGAALRAKGIPTYGILPMPLPMVDELRMHGDNERVPVAALGWAAEFLYRTLERVTAR
ncbi:M20/M25/M40 family metallo-hydrolase [Gemmatimonas phototrophica]|uniref:M20/M25/M40 family metallo-hydrolase n=1 Tax=Gemmatimonas phototrophica TaxID=1379270 RepID=UPI0006A73D93|nr:M20/M25/M40 family metallo-hydrolase [Gemmatimonas phototrophica]